METVYESTGATHPPRKPIYASWYLVSTTYSEAGVVEAGDLTPPENPQGDMGRNPSVHEGSDLRGTPTIFMRSRDNRRTQEANLLPKATNFQLGPAQRQATKATAQWKFDDEANRSAKCHTVCLYPGLSIRLTQYVLTQAVLAYPRPWRRQEPTALHHSSFVKGATQARTGQTLADRDQRSITLIYGRAHQTLLTKTHNVCNDDFFVH